MGFRKWKEMGKGYLVRFLPLDRSQRMFVLTLYPFFGLTKQRIPQMEITLFLSMHRRNLARSPQISRYPLSLGLHPREVGYSGSTALLSKEHIRSGEFGTETPGGELLVNLMR